MQKRLSVEKLEKIVLDNYKKSGKKHLILTGKINIGKTTLFNKLLKSLPPHSGFKTYLEIKDNNRRICFKDIDKDEILTAAEMINYQMEVKDNFFDDIAVSMLKKHLNNEFEYFIFDEIGYVERNSTEYLKILKEIFNKKIVFATMRKDRNAIYGLNEIIDNSYIADLDYINESYS